MDKTLQQLAAQEAYDSVTTSFGWLGNLDDNLPDILLFLEGLSEDLILNGISIQEAVECTKNAIEAGASGKANLLNSRKWLRAML